MRKRIIQESDSSSDEEDKQSIPKKDDSNAPANLIERASHSSSMALHELKKIHNSPKYPNRSNVAISTKRKSPRDVGLEYPDWARGVGRCHIRALSAISLDAAKEAKDRNLRYSDVEEIIALAEPYKRQNKHIFRLFEDTHWVALTDRYFVDDYNLFIIKNFGLAYIKLSLMNGVKNDGIGHECFEALADQPSLIDLTYSMKPSLGDLYHNHEKLNSVKGLKIEKKDVGCVAWKDAVDIRGHDLNKIVFIGKFAVTVSYKRVRKEHPAGGRCSTGLLTYHSTK